MGPRRRRVARTGGSRRRRHPGSGSRHRGRHHLLPLLIDRFALSESPRYVGRAVAAIAADPQRQRWNQQSVASGHLAHEYGFTDTDGTQPDIWRYIAESGK